MVRALGGTSVNMGIGRPQLCGFVVHLINQGVFREGGSLPWNCFAPPPLKLGGHHKTECLCMKFLHVIAAYHKIVQLTVSIHARTVNLHLPPQIFLLVICPPPIYIVSNCACWRDSYFGHHGYCVHIYSMFTYQQVYLYICSWVSILKTSLLETFLPPSLVHSLVKPLD